MSAPAPRKTPVSAAVAIAAGEAVLPKEKGRRPKE